METSPFPLTPSLGKHLENHDDIFKMLERKQEAERKMKYESLCLTEYKNTQRE